MTVRSTQLFLGSAATTNIYTVPSGRRTIVKHLSICHVGNTSTTSVRIDRGASTDAFIFREVMVADVVYRVDLWVVMDAGEILQLITNAGTPANVVAVVSGAELAL